MIEPTSASQLKQAERMLRAQTAEIRRLRAALEIAEQWMVEAWRIADLEASTTTLPSGYRQALDKIRNALRKAA